LVTISIGCAQLSKDDRAATELIQRADEKLYEAKRSGRNRVSS
jgi:diguanylate cyclase (GGDEF)-like protein